MYFRHVRHLQWLAQSPDGVLHATQFVEKKSATSGIVDLPSAAGIGVVAGILCHHDGTVVRSHPTLDGTETLSGKSLTSPNLTTAKGIVQAIEATFTETTGAGVYTGSVNVPAGATIEDIIVNGVALWTATASATLKVGDVADDDGFFTGVDLKATDLLAGESISFAQAGGKAGAYIANSQVSPRYSVAARVISGIVTTVGAAGNAGRTRMTVLYSLPVTADIVAAAKV